jgi:hypothetical protein
MNARLVVTVAVLATMALASACSTGVQSLSFPNPPTTVPVSQAPAPTLPTNLSSVSQAGVAGVPTTTIPPLGPGDATLNGTVFGPNGPLAGASVELDRVVDDTAVAGHATTAADGSWTVSHILGGRYRVRAWQSPSLTMSTPQVVFLDATQTLSMSLRLTQFTGPEVRDAISPPEPVIGQPDNLVVRVTNPTVSTDGVLTYPPATGVQVTLTDDPGWQVGQSNPVTTNSSGDALFHVTCISVGPDPMSAQVGSATPVPLPTLSCAAPPTTSPPPTINPCPTTTIFFAIPTSVPTSTTSTSLAVGGC